MPQSLSRMYAHLVFSTKYRQPFLHDPLIRSEMHSYLGAISKHLSCQPIIVGGVEDHVHILALLGRTATQAGWVKELKRMSCLWIKKRDSSMADFAWQGGYGVFSVSSFHVNTVRAYIARQEEHHRKVKFKDEYRGILRQYKVEWDERYVWD